MRTIFHMTRFRVESFFDQVIQKLLEYAICVVLHAPFYIPCAVTTPCPCHCERGDDDYLTSIHAAPMLDDFGTFPHPLAPTAHNNTEHDLHHPHVARTQPR
mmetsp:Transcript_36522/g.54541  ORF Transcript_36522/g.54541 Transcript_36522/m.54541 type:complete len:101 (-) Transcript_36522:74-376(-)